MTRRPLSVTRRVALFQSHAGVCHLCSGRINAGEAWEISHDIPLELGGADDETNLAPAHAKCHRAHTSTIDIPNIARAKRRYAKHIGARKRSTFPGSRSSKFKKLMNGETVLR
jgi:5-methylcytosine-specific restriction endonuclease McrA